MLNVQNKNSSYFVDSYIGYDYSFISPIRACLCRDPGGDCAKHQEVWVTDFGCRVPGAIFGRSLC